MTNKTIHLEYTSVLAVNFPLDNKICLIYTKIMNINFLPGKMCYIFSFFHVFIFLFLKIFVREVGSVYFLHWNIGPTREGALSASSVTYLRSLE